MTTNHAKSCRNEKVKTRRPAKQVVTDAIASEIGRCDYALSKGDTKVLSTFATNGAPHLGHRRQYSRTNDAEVDEQNQL
ncbi:hypothetical protein [Mycolicibacterium iranicum]|uniref:Uncharacterized protein n=1 Tax=Mycolicibacterium iranicum TaxID=912594 RepID=A0ABT4HKS9_MYCIR|nr:hypothetical protein [Mycolicibacterium iranicum]MCZ0730684.1 hypothetical protein [Mycolicibacterium iranicum]